jgi:hypothetical protein
MPKVNQKGGKQWESPQIVAAQLRTPMKGGKMPSSQDVVKSANARGAMRHEMKGDNVADVKNIANSSKMVGNEMVGVKNEGYLVKKNLEFGVNAFYNSLPPGMDIEDQENCDIRKMETKTVTAMGYPGDGWSEGADRGRPDTTNYT